MRVDLVDPPAYSLPYDHALAVALAGLGVDVRLVTSRFAYGSAPAPEGYVREELFYRHAVGAAGSRLRALSKRVEHPFDVLRYSRAAGRRAEVRHFQWLTVPRLDLRTLPRGPNVLTIHEPLKRDRRPFPASAFRAVEAIVVHTDDARQRVIADHGLESDRVHVIRHGVLTGDPARADGQLPPELPQTDLPVVLCFGLIRPYKGVETLLRSWRGIADAELWIVGRPMIDLASLRREAPPNVRILGRFVTPAEEAALFARADLVVLPYRRSERFGFSGVLATALGCGKAIVLSEVSGLDEVAAIGAARGVAPGDVDALHAALADLLADASERDRLAVAAAEAAATVYSWDAAARATLSLYRGLARG